MAREHRDWLLAGVCAMAIGAWMPAWAQSAAVGAAPPASGDDSAEVEEVVVTAQKREERLVDVPLPVQAIGVDQLENAGATKVSDLVSAIPSASVVSSVTPGFETIQIRGIASGTTGDGLVGYYIDDTPFAIPNLQLTPPARLLDLDRVEVIRGPSGSLYGQGSMGGTIKLVTARPDSNEYSGQVQGEVSDTSGGGTNGNIDGVINVPLLSDRLALRVSAGYESLSGYAEAPELGESDVNDFEGRNARATIAWTPTEDLTLTAFAWTIRNRQDFSNSLTPINANTANPLFFPTPYDLGDIAGTGGRRGFTNIDADIYSGTLNWSTPIGDLTANASNIIHKLDFVTPLLSILVNDSTFKTVSTSQEVRLTAPGDGPFNWIVGAYARQARIKSDIFYYSQFGLTGPKAGIINTFGTIDTESYSLFGEVSFSLFEGRLEPLFGLSYIEDDRVSAGINRNTFAATGAAAKYDSLNPRFNLKYKPTDDAMIYFNAAKGFRSGSLQTQAQADAANVTLGLPTGTITSVNDPDSVVTYELGTRLQLLDRSLVVEGAVYHTEWSDVLVQFATAAVISIANAGDAEIDGVELGLYWRPDQVDGLTLGASGGFNEAKFTSVRGALSLGTAIRVDGPIPNVPESNFTVSADYERDLAMLGGVTGRVYAGYAFRDSQFDATVRNLQSGEVNDLTLRAGIERDNWKLNAFITNALDDDDPAVISSTAYQIIYPRRIGIQLGYDF